MAGQTLDTNLTGFESPDDPAWKRNREILGARDELKDNGRQLEQELATAERRMDDLVVEGENLGKEYQQLENAVKQARQAYDRQVEAATKSIESIEDSAGMQEVADRATAVKESQAAIIEQAKEMVDIVEKDGKASNEQVKKAAGSMKEIISDGKVTKDEMVQLSADMQMIISQFKGQNGRLISINEGLRDLLFAQDMRIQRLESDLRNQNMKHGTPQNFR
jgi:methyl-accepting chemotaxis protein